MNPVVDLTYISEQNESHRKQRVLVANGTTFIALRLANDVKVTSTNIIYLHVHRTFRKCYVGITQQEAGKRWFNGIAYKNNRRFGHALRKYGWDAFDSYVLAFGKDRESLNQAEILAIRSAGGHKSRFTYNLSPGGELVAENDKPLVGVCLATGEKRDFKSGASAARSLKMKNVDMPMAVARGERHSVAGWWFRFKDDLNLKPPQIWGEALRLKVMKEVQGKAVIAINHITNEQLRFSTTAEAAQILGVHQTAVSQIARGKVTSAGGWWFKFEGDSRQKPAVFGKDLTRQKRDVTIYATNLITGEKRSFRNCTVADNELLIYAGGASAVATGQRVSASNWWFSYDEKSIPPSEFKGALVAKARSKPVVATELNTGFEHRFDSAKAASLALNISRAAISKSISGQLSLVKGYKFRFG